MYQSTLMMVAQVVAFLLWPIAVTLAGRKIFLTQVGWPIAAISYVLILIVATAIPTLLPFELYSASFHEVAGDSVRIPTDYTADLLIFADIAVIPLAVLVWAKLVLG